MVSVHARFVGLPRRENIPHPLTLSAPRVESKVGPIMALRLTSPRFSRSFSFLALASLLTSACGDDETSIVTQEPDAGLDAGAVTAAVESSSNAAESSAPDDCASLSAVCRGKDDEDGLGNLCLRVASRGNSEECATLVDECAAFCGSGQEPTIDGGSVSEEQCKAMGSACHDFDEGSGLGFLCHDVGHKGNVAWCNAIFDECVALCGPPDSHHQDEDGGTLETQSVTLRFSARIGERVFACGEEYANFGAAKSVVTPRDLRLYVSAIRFLTPDGKQIPVTIDDLAPFQGGGVALLDFEDGRGECANGDAALNTEITVTAPKGQYTGMAFSTSVPKELNHGDPLTSPAPLRAGGMNWDWLLGYKFIKAEFVQVFPSFDGGAPAAPELDAGLAYLSDAGELPVVSDAMTPVPGVGIFHLGSTGCTNLFGSDAGASAFDVECSKPAFNDIVLQAFNPESDLVLFDVARLFADTDLSTMSMCHGAGDACPSLFAAVGVDFETGSKLATQTAFGFE